MYFAHFVITSLLLFISVCKGAISDERLCGDPTCSEPVSLGLTLLRYTSDDSRILSFLPNVDVKVFSKSAGTRPDLWGVEIDGKRGYAPKSFIKEQKILRSQLEHIISTSVDFAHEVSQVPTPSHLIEGSDNGNVAETKEAPPNNFKADLPFLETKASANGVEKSVPSSEVRQTYEVVDGTTIMFNPDSTEPSLIQATTTESNVLPSTIQFQPNAESTAESLNNPTPNPSLALPNAATSADATGEKQDTEGSAEKIYNYLISNFVSEEGVGEVKSTEAEVDQEDLHSGESNNAEEVVLKPTDSSPESSGSTLDHTHTSTPATSVGVDAAFGTAQTDAPKEGDGIDVNASVPENKESEVVISPMTVENNLGENSDEVGDDEDDEEEDEEEGDDDDEEDADAYISEEGKNSSEENDATNHVETTTDSTHIHPDLVDATKEDQIIQDGANINEAIKSVEWTEEMTKNVVGDGPASFGKTTPASGESRDEDLVSVPSAQAVDLPLLGMNESTSDEVTDLKSFNILTEINMKVDSTTESTDDEHSANIPSNLNLDPNDKPATTSTINLEENLAGRMVLEIAEARDVLLEKSNLDRGDSEEINSSEKPLDLPQTESDEKNVTDDIEPSGSENISHVVNDAKQDQDHVLVPIDPQVDFAHHIPVTEISGNVVHINNDDFVTQSPTDKSTEDYYIDLDEDSPLNVVTETPEPKVDDLVDDAVESSGGFFSGLVGFFTNSETSSPTESEDAHTGENGQDGSVKETEDLNLAQSLLNSDEQHTMVDNLSTCSGQSGNEPDCDNTLYAGTDSSGSDGEAAGLETMEQQVPSVDTWGSGSAYGMISYLAITAISMSVVILGHWFIEKYRCDSKFIKRINDLERALLYAELESQNLKADLEDTRNSVLNSEDDDGMKAIREQLQTALDNATGLEEKNASLQESLDAATEAGLELNRMLSDILSTNKGSESLMLSVNDLQIQLNSQQTTINNMNSVLNLKEGESEVLRNNLATAQGTIQSLEQDLKHVSESLQKRLEEKWAEEERFISVKLDLENRLKATSSKENDLVEKVGALQLKIREMENDRNARDIEVELLRDCVRKLKEDPDDDFKVLLDVAKAKALCQELQTERDQLAEELQGEKDARRLLADHVEVTTKEVETLWNAMEQNEKEKQEALTKYAVLADYFKDKESQLHKELGYKDAMYMQSQGEATSTHEEIKALHEQVESYKSQIETLKTEIVDQERGLKSQILAFEKKAYDNWLVGRQADRQLQEAKIEAAILRNRLTIVEKNASNAGHNDVPALDMKPQLLAPKAAVHSLLQPPHYALLPQPLEETDLHSRPNHASPALGTRSQPVIFKNPANLDVAFPAEEVHGTQSPLCGTAGPSAPYDSFQGRPVQDGRNSDHYETYFRLIGASAIMLPPPLPPNVPGTRDRRPPPLGRMSSPPVGERMSPQPPRGHKVSPVHGHMISPLKHSTPPPPERRRRGSSPSNRTPASSMDRDHSRSPSPERGRRRSLQRGRGTPTRRTMSRSMDRERRRSEDSNSQSRVSPSSRGRLPSPVRDRSYRRRTRSPSPYSSDGSTPESRRRYSRRFDFSPDTSYRGRSRTPSPTSFRPISRHANQGSSHSYESDESNRRIGRP